MDEDQQKIGEHDQRIAVIEHDIEDLRHRLDKSESTLHAYAALGFKALGLPWWFWAIFFPSVSALLVFILADPTDSINDLFEWLGTVVPFIQPPTR